MSTTRVKNRFGVSPEDIEEKQRAAKRTRRLIQDHVLDDAVTADESSHVSKSIVRDEFAWGQYLNEGIHGIGTYGTAAALQILSLGEDDRYLPSELADDRDEILHRGRTWLDRQWCDPASHTQQRFDEAVVYRCVAFCLGISPDESDWAYAADELGKHVWEMHDDGRWSDFCYEGREPNPKYNKPRELSTAMALFGLSQCPDQRCEADYFQRMIDLVEAIDEKCQGKDNRRVLVEASICLIALARFDRLDQRMENAGPWVAEMDSIDVEIKSRIDKLVSIIQEILGEQEDETFYIDRFYIRLYSTPEPDHRYRYYPFLIGPIVALALLEAGKSRPDARYVEQNLSFVHQTIDTYVEEISDENPYISEQRGPASIGDHTWIAECLQCYAEYPVNEIKQSAVIRGKVSRKVQKKMVLFTFFVIVLIGATVLSQVTSGWTTTIWSAASALLGATIAEMGLPHPLKAD